MRTPVLLLLGSLILPTLAGARVYDVTVPAATVDRAAVVVTLQLPDEIGANPALRDASGRLFAVQPGPAGQAQAVLPFLRAGEAGTFTLVNAPRPTVGTNLERAGPQLDVRQGENPVLTYWIEPRPRPNPEIDPVYLRNGFIHPVVTPAGVVVTDSYPADHLHHHGIWSPWTKTEFQGRSPDFWNMGQRRGTVEGLGVQRTWQGPVHGGFVATHRFVDLTAEQPVVALHETWEVTTYAVAAERPAHVFDLVITQTCATDDPLILPEYHYGGLGYRGHGQWNGAANATFLTSEGVTDRVKAHATRARWCHVGGKVDGQFAGTAILGHPDNFRAPQPMRIHPTEPFFCFAPSQLGQWSIEPGQPYVARYRFVVMDGPPDAALLDAYWAGYAEPATATVSAR